MRFRALLELTVCSSVQIGRMDAWFCRDYVHHLILILIYVRTPLYPLPLIRIFPLICPTRNRSERFSLKLQQTTHRHEENEQNEHNRIDLRHRSTDAEQRHGW